jgi:hypothetical protein
MKYCLFVREDLAVLKNDFFDKEDLNGMKSDTYMYKELRLFLSNAGIDLNTQYTNKPEESDVIICLNETGFFMNYKRQKVNKLIVLILTEPPVYNAIDWTTERHTCFDKVFSYDSDLLLRDPIKYIHINFPIDLNFVTASPLPKENEFNKKLLSSLVAGAISITEASPEKKSLLFERYKILKWYNKNDPSSLHFYSRTSPLNKFEYFRGASLINKINSKITSGIAKILFKNRIAKVYKGSIPSLSKNEVLSNYKFNFCLENSSGIKGLISEKIFDCFIGRTIPVYLGAPDIEQYIPKKCFILYSDFKNLNELNNFLKQMNYKTYIQYLVNADDFLDTAKDIFSTKTFIEKIYKETKL